jgi:transcriptional regulator with XRE-family HTH domain
MSHLPIGDILRHARKLRLLSQDTVAKRMGVPRSHIGKIENGAVTPHIGTFLRFCDALDIEGWRVLRAMERHATGAKKPPQRETVTQEIREAIA